MLRWSQEMMQLHNGWMRLDVVGWNEGLLSKSRGTAPLLNSFVPPWSRCHALPDASHSSQLLFSNLAHCPHCLELSHFGHVCMT